MTGSGGQAPPRRAIKVLLGGAALAFSLAGFIRALIVAIAAHTEFAVIQHGGLASIGPTSRGLAILGAVLALAAAVLGYRWVQRLAAIPPAPLSGPSADDRPLPRGVRLVLPAGLWTLDRRLSGTDSGLFRGLAILAWLATILAVVVSVAVIVAGFAWGDAGMPIGLRLEIVAFGAATVAALAAIWIVDRLGEGAADRTSPYATPIPTRRRGLRALPVAVLLALVLYPAATVMVAGAREAIHCPGLPGGDCRLVTVSLDHRHPEDGRTLDVIYRVAAAQGARIGTLFVAVGGPGVRGLSEADPWLGLADPAIREHYDIVFFDQRGVGGSGGPDCGNAVHQYQATTRGDRIAIDRAFVQACLAELGDATRLLPYDSTRQAAADVDAIRAAMGVDRIALYGESYGTRLAQAYAALYPDHVTSLVLDGAIDPDVVGLAFWRESAHGFQATLDASLAACAAEPTCRADVAGGDPRAAFDRQLAATGASPVPVDYPNGFGLERMGLEPADLIDATSLALYDVQIRMELQRAVAAASHDDWLAWARLVKATRPQPVTSRLDAGPTTRGPWPAAHLGPWTPAAYLAVECADIDAPGLADGLAAFQAVAEDPGLDAGPFAGIVYQDAACLGWPRPVDGRDPRPPTTLRVPTLVLAATADPITPVANAERIVKRTPGAGLVVTDGGPHVTYLRGDSCVDGAVRRFLVDSQPPQSRTDCSGRVAAPYVPRLGPVRSIVDTDEGIQAVADEVGVLPEVTTWDGLGTFRIGCDAGGYLTVYGFPDEINLLVSRCAFVPGYVLDGTGTMDPATRRVSLSVTRVP